VFRAYDSIFNKFIPKAIAAPFKFAGKGVNSLMGKMKKPSSKADPATDEPFDWDSFDWENPPTPTGKMKDFLEPSFLDKMKYRVKPKVLGGISSFGNMLKNAPANTLNFGKSTFEKSRDLFNTISDMPLMIDLVSLISKKPKANIRLESLLRKQKLFHGSKRATSDFVPETLDFSSHNWFGASFFATASKELAKTYGTTFKVGGSRDAAKNARILDLTAGAPAMDRQFPGIVDFISESLFTNISEAEKFTGLIKPADVLKYLRSDTRHLAIAADPGFRGVAERFGIDAIRHTSGQGAGVATAPKNMIDDVFAFFNPQGTFAKVDKGISNIVNIKEFIKKGFGYANSIPEKIGSGIKSKFPMGLNFMKQGREGESSIRGIFDRLVGGTGWSTFGKTNIKGENYFLKSLGNKAKVAHQHQTDAFGNAFEKVTPEADVNTAMQEHFISKILNKSGSIVPDLKFFPDMSDIDNGLILGSRAIPDTRDFGGFEEFMKGLKVSDPKRHKDLFGKLISRGTQSYAEREAVINAIFETRDRNLGNSLFNTETGMMHNIDFARTGVGIKYQQDSAPKTAFDLARAALSDAVRMQSRIMSNSGLDQKSQMEVLGSKQYGVPHSATEIDFAPPGSIALNLGQRVADMKPTAQRIAEALGFDLSMDKLPANFAANNSIIKNAMKELKNSNLDRMLLNNLDPNAQQGMLDLVFRNIKTILESENATFRYAKGGMVGKPKYFAKGGMVGMYANGGDVVPSMLTPGEFVVRQPAVKDFGADNLKAINNGTYGGNSVYNSYEVNVNVSSMSNPNEIANAVLTKIRQIDSQTVRGVRV
jgi:hypothetical protein